MPPLIFAVRSGPQKGGSEAVCRSVLGLDIGVLVLLMFTTRSSAVVAEGPCSALCQAGQKTISTYRACIWHPSLGVTASRLHKDLWH